MISQEDVDRTIGELRAAGYYVNSRGMVNAKGAAHLLCLSISRLRNLHTNDKEAGISAPRSYRPSGSTGPRYYLVADVLEFIETRMAKKCFPADNQQQPRTTASNRAGVYK